MKCHNSSRNNKEIQLEIQRKLSAYEKVMYKNKVNYTV